MDQFNTYAAALESFDKEVQTLNADWMIYSFMANEADEGEAQTEAKEKFKLRNTKAWEGVRTLATKIWTFLKGVAETIGKAVMGLIAAIGRAPSKIKAAPSTVKNAMAAAKAKSDRAKSYREAFNRVLKFINKAETEMSGEEMQELQGQIDELKAMLRKADNDADKVTVNLSGATDSFIAMEAEGEENAKEGKGFHPIDGLKNLLSGLGKSAKDGSDQVSKAQGKVKAKVDAEAKQGDGDPQKTSLRTRIWSGIMNILGSIGRFFSGIPSFIAGIWRKIFPKKAEGAQTENYEGPNPAEA